MDFRFCRSPSLRQGLSAEGFALPEGNGRECERSQERVDSQDLHLLTIFTRCERSQKYLPGNFLISNIRQEKGDEKRKDSSIIIILIIMECYLAVLGNHRFSKDDPGEEDFREDISLDC